MSPKTASLKIHNRFRFTFEELSLAVVSDDDGRRFELDCFAYGEAEIGYDRHGEWQIEAIYIDGRPTNDSRSRGGKLIKLNAQPLWDLVKSALIREKSNSITADVFDRLDREFLRFDPDAEHSTLNHQQQGIAV